MILVASSPADPFNEPIIRALGEIAQPFPLPYGDAIFEGYWEHSQVVPVLIERKRIFDFVNSILTGHHLKQVQAAASAGFHFQWLIVEGPLRPNPDTGLAETHWGGGWKSFSEVKTAQGQIPDLEYRRLDDYWNQCELFMGIHCKTSRNAAETARQILDLFYLFQKPPHEHSTLKNLYQQTMVTGEGRAYLMPPTLLEKVTMQLPGVGWERGRAIAAELKTLERFCQVVKDGDVKALMKASGVGKKIAQGILEGARES